MSNPHPDSLPEGEGTALLSVRDVSLRFGGVAALDHVSFDIRRGQIVGLIGPNGAGKTSLFNCISRLYQPGAGSIRLEEHELLRLRPHEVIRLGIARTFQNVALFSRMSVLDNVLVGDHTRIPSDTLASALRFPRARRAEAQAVERALAALDIVDMRTMAHVLAGSLPFAIHRIRSAITCSARYRPPRNTHAVSPTVAAITVPSDSSRSSAV